MEWYSADQVCIFQSSLSQISQAQPKLFLLKYDHMFWSTKNIIRPLSQKFSK